MTPRNRIKRIQKHLGITADGLIGPQTLRHIEQALGVIETPKPYSGPHLDVRSEKYISTLQPAVQDTFRKFLAEAKAKADEYGCRYILISGNRTWKEQDALYAKGRSEPGKKVTNARGGYSNHNYGIAVDGAVFSGGGLYLDSVDPKLAEKVHREVAVIAKKYGLKWGGDWKRFKDYPHFEYDTGLTITAMRKKMKSGKAIV